MKVIREEASDKSKHRKVHYHVPRLPLRITYFYYGSERQLRVNHISKGYKLNDNSRYTTMRPYLRFDNDACMVMFETFMTKLLEQYRTPSHSYRTGSYSHALLVWLDILDRYINGDRTATELFLGFHSVNAMVKEMKHHAKH